MATASSITNPVFDSILPVYGNPRKNTPVWNEDDKMFIFDEYTSSAGHLYYRGLRFTNRIAVVENIGLYHTCKYIDSIEVYTYNNNSKSLIGSVKYEKTFYNRDMIRRAVESIIKQYVQGQLKVQNLQMNEDVIEQEAKKYVEESYISFLSDDFGRNMTNMLPMFTSQQ